MRTLLSASALAVAATLAACGSTTVTDLKATGMPTARYASAKTPMEFAICVIPIHDIQAMIGDPAQLRPTATGIEILKTVDYTVLSIISVDSAGEGSTIIGLSTIGFPRLGERLGNLESVIRQCA